MCLAAALSGLLGRLHPANRKQMPGGGASIQSCRRDFVPKCPHSAFSTQPCVPGAPPNCAAGYDAGTAARGGGSGGTTEAMTGGLAAGGAMGDPRREGMGDPRSGQM